ncbi:hypothetical protein B0H14DRAFT_3880990 [Mycena olivaceomarginata]|nr:hypothetical protein B0H14DRAFT_3880990 [Mycena olivaceomarginata]
MLTSFLPTPPPLPYRARVSVDTTAPALFGPSNREPTLFTSTCHHARLNPAEVFFLTLSPGSLKSTSGTLHNGTINRALSLRNPHSAFAVHLPSPAPRSSLSLSYIRSKQHSVTIPPKDQHSGCCTFRGRAGTTSYIHHKAVQPRPASQVLCATSGISRSGGAGSLDKRLVSRTESVLPAPAPPCGPEHCRIVRTHRALRVI